MGVELRIYADACGFGILDLRLSAWICGFLFRRGWVGSCLRFAGVGWLGEGGVYEVAFGSFAGGSRAL